MGLIAGIKSWLGSGQDKPPVQASREAEPAAPSQPSDYYDEAFETATTGIEWSDEAKEQVRPVLFSVINEGGSQARKALESVWPEEFNWPEAEAYLASASKKVKPLDYADLLRRQVGRIAYSQHRIDQIKNLISDPASRKHRPYLMYRGDEGEKGSTLCGKPEQLAISVEDAMRNGLEPCTVVGCDCKLFSLSERDVARFAEQ